MFSTGDDAAVPQAARPRPAYFGDLVGISAERAIADDRIFRIGIHVEHGRKVEVDADQREFFGCGTAELVSELRISRLANPRSCGKVRKGWREPVDSAAFLVDGDEGGNFRRR